VSSFPVSVGDATLMQNFFLGFLVYHDPLFVVCRIIMFVISEETLEAVILLRPSVPSFDAEFFLWRGVDI
jgi:hypothetical protein